MGQGKTHSHAFLFEKVTFDFPFHMLFIYGTGQNLCISVI